MSKNILYELLKRPVAYQPLVAKTFGSVPLAVLWSQLYYWHDKGRDPNGWIYKTVEDLYDETGLTRRNQETARRLGKKLGVIETKVMGMPATVHYKINIDKMIELIAEQCELPEETPEEKPKEEKKPGKKKYGEFKNVLLTDDEKEKLIAKFGTKGAKHWVKTLDEGIEMKGYKYKSHYLAILKWSKRPNAPTFQGGGSRQSDLERKERKRIQEAEDERHRRENARGNEQLRAMLRKKEQLKKQQNYGDK